MIALVAVRSLRPGDIVCPRVPYANMWDYCGIRDPVTQVVFLLHRDILFVVCSPIVSCNVGAHLSARREDDAMEEVFVVSALTGRCGYVDIDELMRLK